MKTREMKKGINFGMFLLLGILLISFGSATYMRSNVQYTQPSSGFSAGGYWQPDRSMCEAGQDFIIQIAPFGCTPTVVRSDLLEEQNVPVFCQLGATKINPLIDIEAIESLSFSGRYPEEVSGVGFHPASAALGVSGDLNSPVLNNIGYAVIVLKKQENASAMPDFVQGNLTVKIEYDIQNALGIGKATFYLPEMSEEDWNKKHSQYNFWNGRFYLRAEGIDNEGATVLVYDDTRRISTVSLEKGETSEMIYLPGFDCLAGLKLKLDGLEAPDTRAKLDINGEIVEVAEDEKFLENRCWVTNIDKKGLVQKVTIKCKEDESSGFFGSESFDLMISPKIKLDFDGAKEEGYEVGKKLPFSDDKNKNVYLGYIGTEGDSGKEKDLRIRFVQVPREKYNYDYLSDDMISEVARYDIDSLDAQKGGVLSKIFSVVTKSSSLWIERFARYIVQGTEIRSVFKYSEKGNVYGTEVTLVGFAGAQDVELNESIKENYQNAIKDYDNLINSFSSEKFTEGFDEITYGEEALYRKILLAYDVGQRKTVVDLCKEFENKYPKSEKPLETQCKDTYKLSSSEISTRDVLVNGVKRISFDGIYEPSVEEYGAEIFLSGVGVDYSGKSILQKNEEAYFSDSEFIELKELHEDYALFDVSSVKESSLREVAWKTDYLKINLNDYKVIGENNYQIKLTKINLKKSAKVSVVPNIDNAGTEANFSFKIGIEKRAIQLSPEKTLEKIKSLNETIEKWEEKSEQLGKVVKGLKTACLGVGAYLTVKNLFSNVGGKSIARQEVMRSEGGWYDKCADLVNKKEYTSVEQCLYKEGDNIERDVNTYYEALEKQNEEIKALQKDYETTKFLTETHIDTDKFGKEYIPFVKTELEKTLDVDREIDVNGEKVKVSEIVNMVDSSKVSISQARELQLKNRLEEKEQVDKILKDIYVNNKAEVARETLANKFGVSEADYGSVKEKMQKFAITKDITWGDVESQFVNETEGIEGKNYIRFYGDKGTGSKEYLVVLNNEYHVTKTYEIITDSESGLSGLDLYSKDGDENPFDLDYEKQDAEAYKNHYESPELRYYETAPYNGLPAVVPFDLDEGWYAYVSQTLPVLGNIGSYDTSGRVSSLYVCNVWDNKREDNKGGDDKCTMVNLGTGQPYNQIGGLTETEARKIVGCAVDAVEQASRQHKSGVKRVQISTACGKFYVEVGKPAVDIPDMQCQDFMSPTDCFWLFNVCDPVVCPSSRCDFGGSYPVSDVIQSGIIGSIFLCLPNWNEGIRVPVCLSGIKAGIDGLLSVYTSYRDCLQESLDTGKMVGVCDEIYSIYLCEFFWRQALPIANLVIPKMMEMLMGQNVRGGGEYLGVASAWDNAGKSMDYFVQYYAADAYTAFKARVSEKISDAFCDVFISGSYPDGGNLIDSLTEPDSPPQFHGRFDEIPFTTATVPPISHYKVFYHIYAGKESRAYYKVYLKASEGTSFYQDTSTIRFVDSGYIVTGGYVSETLDFTAPSGYKEMCIMVNNQEECGFKEVSTSFAVDYIEDQYKKEQASATDIKTETECVSGTASLYSLLTPSAEGAAEEIIDPAIYNKGIIRICATESPGKATDALDGTGSARWIPVGYCGDENMKCWLDTKSVENTMEFNVSAQEVLKEQSDSYLEILMSEGDYFTEEEVNSKIDEIEKESNLEEKIKLINGIFEKVFWNNQKAHLLLLRGNAYANLARALYRSVEQEKTNVPASVPDSDSDSGIYSGDDEVYEEEPVEEKCTEYLCEAATSVSVELNVVGGKCHIDIGKRIMEIAKEIKEEENIDDAIVKRDTGAENFECLVLQLAMQESCLAHCVYNEEEKDYKYCDGNSNLVVKGDKDNSIGVMQININANPSMENKAFNFEENVRYGIKNILVDYAWKLAKKSTDGRYYDCKKETYSGWNLALRYYNGWYPQDCSKGDKDYVEHVLGRQDEIAELFPECA